MEKVYLALGSNLGDRAANISRAIQAFAARGVRVTKHSALYETEPVNARGGWFLNAAIEVATELSPAALMAALLEVEESLGRTRSNAPQSVASDSPDQIKDERALDIDILLFGKRVIETQQLQIPHARMAERRFVLVPLAEIAPQARHPVLKKTVAELLAATSDRSEVRRFRDGRSDQF